MERLREEVTGLENHCGRLTGQLNRTQDELDHTQARERELTIKVKGGVNSPTFCKHFCK